MSTDLREIQERIAVEIDGISPRRLWFDRMFVRAVSVALESLLRHWLLLANSVNAVLTIGAIAVPLMMAAGWTGPPASLFGAYHWLCEQRPERSYFLLGYQMGMDQRMMAIYGSSLLAGLLFIPLRGKTSPLSWRAFFLLSVPIAVDGFTQLFGWRYSTWELRTITGTLFGAGTVWLVYPYLFNLLTGGGRWKSSL